MANSYYRWVNCCGQVVATRVANRRHVSSCRFCAVGSLRDTVTLPVRVERNDHRILAMATTDGVHLSDRFGRRRRRSSGAAWNLANC